MSDTKRNIVVAALEIADEKGLAAVSMRSVAARVGVSAMALYPHVQSKEALLDDVLGLLLSEQLPILDSVADEDWWTRLVALAHGVRKIARRHPSAFALLLSRPSVTPDAVRATEALYAVLLDAGVPERDVPRLERLLATFVLGFATSEANGRFAGHALSPAERRRQLPPDEVPAHHRLATHLDRRTDWDAEFATDLESLKLVVLDAVPAERPPARAKTKTSAGRRR